MINQKRCEFRSGFIVEREQGRPRFKRGQRIKTAIQNLDERGMMGVKQSFETEMRNASGYVGISVASYAFRNGEGECICRRNRAW